MSMDKLMLQTRTVLGKIAKAVDSYSRRLTNGEWLSVSATQGPSTRGKPK
jgi:GTP cyclohydrolase I